MTATTLLYSQLLQTITPPSRNLSPKASNVSVRECSPATSETPIVSPLLGLPLELRLQIYTHALALHSPPSPEIPTSDHLPVFANHISTSLLLVNRQIYHETHLLPLSTNTFVYTNCFGSSVYSARKFLTRLENWQIEALRGVEITVVGRAILEGWRREEGWESVMTMLSRCKKVHVKVRIQEGDVWIGNSAGAVDSWMINGGNVGPGIGTLWGVVMPVRSEGKDGWVKRLVEGGVRGEGVMLEFLRC